MEGFGRPEKVPNGASSVWGNNLTQGIFGCLNDVKSKKYFLGPLIPGDLIKRLDFHNIVYFSYLRHI